MKKAILRIKTPPPFPADWNRPAGVYVGTEIECMVIDAETREEIAILENVQTAHIHIRRDDFVTASILTDAIELDIEVEGNITSEAKKEDHGSDQER